MFDLEANKSIALRLVKVFNGRRLDLLEHVLHPEVRGRSAFPPVDPGVSPCLTSKRTRASRYDWSRFSTAADSTCLNMCFIPSSAGAEFSAFPPVRRSAKALRDVLSSDPRRAGRGARRCRGRRQVVLVDRFGGTHRGEFLGRPGTGDRIEWMAIHIYTIRDGKVLEDAKWPTPKPSMRIGE